MQRNYALHQIRARKALVEANAIGKVYMIKQSENIPVHTAAGF